MYDLRNYYYSVTAFYNQTNILGFNVALPWTINSLLDVLYKGTIIEKVILFENI